MSDPRDPADPAEAFLSAALEERAGLHLPPDLTERILARAAETAPRHPVRWLGAATLLLGAGVLAAVFFWSDATPGDAAGAQDPAPDTVVEPADRADWRRLLADVEGVSARVHVLPRSRIAIAGAGRRLAPDMDVAQGERARELASALAALEPRGYDGPWEVSHDLSLRLREQRAVRFELQCTSRPWVARIPPLGFAVVDSGLQGLLESEIALADRSTQVATGVVGADDVRGDRFAMIGDDAEVLRPNELSTDQLPLVLRYRQLRELDLRGSPALHNPALLGQLRALSELAVLHLNAPWTQPEDVGALAAISSLTELRLATVTGGTKTATLRVGVVEAVLELSLGSVALPGEMVTDEDLELLSRSRVLRSLDLSRWPPTNGSVTDAGLARLASMASLRRLVLDGWFVVPAGFGFTNFGLSAFQDTDGDGLPDMRVPNGTAGLDPGWRAALSDLVCRSAVRDLSLRSWLRLADEDVAGWKGKIGLDRLDLTGCTMITDLQIRELRAASPGCEIAAGCR